MRGLPVPAAPGPFERRRPRILVLGACLALILAAAWGLEARSSTVITDGPRSRPWVALTFDDGWSADRCARIVRTLRAKGATATFFINGSIVKAAPKRWRSMLKGFPVANHTLTHPWLTRLGASQVRTQILANQQAHERILGRPMLRLLRPPYGAYDGRVVSIADSLGYRTMLWDTSGGDTNAGATTSSVIRAASRGGRGAIVLLHCGPAVTPAAVGPIIDRYRARGLRLVGLDEMLGGAAPRPPKACRVRDRATGMTYPSLQRAVEAASAGRRLTLRGTCKGTTLIGKSLRVRGTRTADSGPPTLHGRAGGSVVTIGAGATVSMAALRITGGDDPSGGGVDNRGSLTLVDVIVSDNRAEEGGGILNRPGASLRLRGAASIRRNTAADRGGGVLNRRGAVVRMSGASSIRRNAAGQAGGGVLNARSALLVLADSSAIHVNVAGAEGGGVHTGGALVIRDGASIRANEAAFGGGILRWDGELTGVECGVNVAANTPDDCAPPAPEPPGG